MSDELKELSRLTGAPLEVLELRAEQLLRDPVKMRSLQRAYGRLVAADPATRAAHIKDLRREIAELETKKGKSEEEWERLEDLKEDLEDLGPDWKG